MCSAIGVVGVFRLSARLNGARDDLAFPADVAFNRIPPNTFPARRESTQTVGK
jgi:hypothetical protein